MENWQITFATLADFGCKVGGGLSESIKKKNLWQKPFFSDNVEWSSKILWKMISADVKANNNN